MALRRLLIDLIFACFGALIVVAALSAFRQGLIGDDIARIVFGVDASTRFPMSIQALSWVVFAVGLGELVVRAVESSREASVLKSGLLPARHGEVFRVEDLGEVYRRARKQGEGLMLGRAVMRIVS
ncbi:MAG: hypothetical protein AAFP78_15790, partial [Pseudomonadota bacterium]